MLRGVQGVGRPQRRRENFDHTLLVKPMWGVTVDAAHWHERAVWVIAAASAGTGCAGRDPHPRAWLGGTGAAGGSPLLASS